MINLVKDSFFESEYHSLYPEMSNFWRYLCGKGRKELWSSLKCQSHLAMELGGRSDFGKRDWWAFSNSSEIYVDVTRIHRAVRYWLLYQVFRRNTSKELRKLLESNVGWRKCLSHRDMHFAATSFFWQYNVSTALRESLETTAEEVKWLTMGDIHFNKMNTVP